MTNTINTITLTITEEIKNELFSRIVKVYIDSEKYRLASLNTTLSKYKRDKFLIKYNCLFGQYIEMVRMLSKINRNFRAEYETYEEACQTYINYCLTECNTATLTL